jgi:hypothetical protein
MTQEALTVTCSYCRQAIDRPLYHLATGESSYGLFPFCIGCNVEADATAGPLTLALLADAAAQAMAGTPDDDPDDFHARHDALLRLAEAVRVYAAQDEGEEWPR